MFVYELVSSEPLQSTDVQLVCESEARLERGANGKRDKKARYLIDLKNII